MVKKVAILGGGMAALTTALELTATHDLRTRHEVTVYQMGWRLGGKCASGRDASGRVLEHGIHLFGGGYYNALPLLQDVYDELNAGAGGWHSTFKQSFEKQFVSVRVDPAGAAMPPCDCADLPPNTLQPADGRTVRSPRDWLQLLLRMLRDWLLPRAEVPGNLAHDIFGGLPLLDALLPVTLLALEAQLTRLQIEVETNLPVALATVQGLQSMLSGWAMASSSKGSLLAANYLLALVRATVLDLQIKGQSFNDLDSQDWDTWLSSHGAWPETTQSSIALSPLRILYQSPEGDPTQRFSMGAGAYLHWTLRQLAYLGAPFWFFTYGTGDSVVMPIYQLLQRRGVKFEFFHRVEALHLDALGHQLDSVDLRVQATLVNPDVPYQPEVGFNGMPCWPDRPVYAQLTEGAALSALPPEELENYWSAWRAPGLPTKTLKLGTDFDVAVFAISLGAVPLLCRELLAASGTWREMVRKIPTVETQSLQIWLSKSSAALGAPNCHPTDTNDTGLGCGFATPFDGFSDFSLLIDHEGWTPMQRPRSLWYFSDVLRQDGPQPPDMADLCYPQRRHAQVVANSIDFLDRHLGRLLPGSVAGAAFRYNTLLFPVPGPGPSPAQCLATQWVRANVQPSDRYVQAPAGSTRARLEAGDSRFSGLVLAGDWTYTGLNVGCVEAAVMSGRLASNAICASPRKTDIAGYFPPL
jgi:uncharacterized protein with NAD-binding domain and iron-sulfur cluster